MKENSDYYWENGRCQRITLAIETTVFSLIIAGSFLNLLYLRYGEALLLALESIPVIVVQLFLVILLVPTCYCCWITQYKCQNSLRPFGKFPKLGWIGAVVLAVSNSIASYLEFAVGVLLILIGGSLIALAMFDARRRPRK